jgi:hypothetical protein
LVYDGDGMTWELAWRLLHLACTIALIVATAIAPSGIEARLASMILVAYTGIYARIEMKDARVSLIELNEKD